MRASPVSRLPAAFGPSRRTRPHLPLLLPSSLVVLAMLSGCSRRSSSSSAPPSDPCPDGTPFAQLSAPTPLDLPPSSFSGVTVRLDPFAGKDQLSATWWAPSDRIAAEALRFVVPKTMEGFHWEWSTPGASRFWLASPSGSGGWSWGGGCSMELKALDAVAQRAATERSRAVGFAIDTDNPPGSSSWPAVVGLGSSETKVLSLAALSPLMPSDPSAPLRVELASATPDEVRVVSRATSCGPLCLEFPNLLAAFDTPFVVTRRPENVFDETSAEGVRLVAALRDSPSAAGVPAAAEGVPAGDVGRCQTSFRSALGTAGRLFTHLRGRWGSPSLVSDRYDIYLSHREGSLTYQGLEHSGSTLIAMMGDCATEGYLSMLNKVTAHEMVHVWNVRHLIPSEHGTHDFGSFNVERTVQLYFYEGWTEGYARVAMAELGILPVAVRSSDWNQSFKSLYAAGGGQRDAVIVLNASQPNNVFGQYQTGASFLLYVAMKLRLAAGDGADGEQQARERLWQLLENLRQKSEANGQSERESSWQQPPWARRAWSGLVAGPDSSGRYGTGYTSSDVVQVLEAAVGAGALPGTSGSTVSVTVDEFESTLRSFAERFSVPLRIGTDGYSYLDLATADASASVPWPF